jgi:hypothetical protein
MTNNQKAATAALILALIYFLQSFLTNFQELVPIVSPSPVASVSQSPSPVVSVIPTPSPSKLASIKLMQGEVYGLIIRKPTGSEIPAGATVFEIKTVNTLIPSFKGARVGAYEDPLVPTTLIDPKKNYWVDFVPPISGSYVILGQTLSFEYTNQIYKQTVPFYMELQFNQVSKAHGLADEGSTLAARGAINKKYRDLYRAHGIEPIKQAIIWTPSDLNQFSAQGASYRQTVLDGAIAPPCLLGPTPGIIPTAAQINLLKSAAPNGWFYAWDEGEGTLDDQAFAAAKNIKDNGGKVYLTRQWSSRFASVVDLFIPVFNFLQDPSKVPLSAYNGNFGTYVSCMSNGNCVNQSDANLVAPATKFPMMVLDAPFGDAKRFVTESIALGAKVLLYFNGTQKLHTAWADGGQYNEGGNGDGTLVYPCGDNACPSLRMKQIRQGLYDAARF